jgi:hypothetical protein
MVSGIIGLCATSLASCNGPMGITTTHWERSDFDCGAAAATRAWATAAPADLCLDPAALEQEARRIERGERGNVHALLVVREGKLVFERYFEGRDAILGMPLGRVDFGPATLHEETTTRPSREWDPLRRSTLCSMQSCNEYLSRLLRASPR